MKDTTLRGKYLNRLAALLAAGVLACGAPLALAQTTMGNSQATQKANENAVAQGANLGQGSGANLGRGAAPLPEPGTWAVMGTLLVAAAALVAREKRRRSNG